MPDRKLRGNPEGLIARIPKTAPNYGSRPDGTPKGLGYFGEIARTDEPDYISTELSATVGIDGEERLIPIIVPTLTAEELAHLVDGGQPTVGIVRKAVEHARARIKANKSPYAEPNERHPLPKSPSQQFEEGYTK